MPVATTLATVRPETGGVALTSSVKCEAAGVVVAKVGPDSSTSSVAPCRAVQVSGAGLDASFGVASTLWPAAFTISRLDGMVLLIWF